jgi:hypothetical protein
MRTTGDSRGPYANHRVTGGFHPALFNASQRTARGERVPLRLARDWLRVLEVSVAKGLVTADTLRMRPESLSDTSFQSSVLVRSVKSNRTSS